MFKPVSRTLKTAGLLLTGLLLLVIAAWGVLALVYFDDMNEALRAGLAFAFGIASLVALVALAQPRWRWRAVTAFLVLFALLLACWSAISPSNDRAWRPEVAVLAYATIDGDRITVHNIRNFDYRTETDFTPGYYDRIFDLRQLDSVDLIAVYWMGPAIAHTFLSFGFTDGQHLAISIEARNTRDKSYSTVKGFFRQSELYYVVADERDVIRLRTNYRHDPPEEVYVYRLTRPAEDGRRVFLSYMKEINSLKDHPEFYNTLTTNCTTNIWKHAQGNVARPTFSWKILLSGYVPSLLYDSGRLDTRVPFEQLRERSHVNARAQAADQAADFSQRIRAASVPAASAPAH